MKQRSIGLRDPLYSVLIEQDLNEFTVTELRDACLSHPACEEQDPIEVRRIGYTQVLRLLKLGLLEKLEADHPYQTRYRKLPTFHQVAFYNKTSGSPKLDSAQHETFTPTSNSKEVAEHSKLSTKLQQYRAQLLTSIGESEEYQHLLAEFPEYQQVIQEKYEHARDESTRLLGKLKAVEELVAYEQANT